MWSSSKNNSGCTGTDIDVPKRQVTRGQFSSQFEMQLVPSVPCMVSSRLLSGDLGSAGTIPAPSAADATPSGSLNFVLGIQNEAQLRGEPRHPDTGNVCQRQRVSRYEETFESIRNRTKKGSLSQDRGSATNILPAPIARPERGCGVGRREQIMQQPDWRPRIPSTPQTPETSSVQGSITTSCIRETDRGSFQTIRGNDCVRTNLKSIQIKAIAQAVEDEQARILELEGPWFLSTFRPSYSAQLSLGLPPNLVFSRNFTQAAQDSSSPNYLGDLSVARNKSANIPENENCALWIMGVHPGVTHRALLAAIRGVGNVYAAVINPPRGFHSGAATKIVFFARHEAEKLFKLISSGRFRVMGQKVTNVRWNKIKSAPYLQPGSRAIRITGPEELMNFDFFESFFKARFTYELDRKMVVHCSEQGMVSHEWHFGSFRCQAGSAKTAIQRELLGIFEVTWAPDPCAGP